MTLEDRNVEACENAKTPASKCRCKCRGAAHGKARDRRNLDATDPHAPDGNLWVVRLVRIVKGERSATLDTFELPTALARDALVSLKKKARMLTRKMQADRDSRGDLRMVHYEAELVLAREGRRGPKLYT